MLANMPLIWEHVHYLFGNMLGISQTEPNQLEDVLFFFVGSWGLQIQEPGKNTSVVKRLKVNIFGPGTISDGLNCLVCFIILGR